MPKTFGIIVNIGGRTDGIKKRVSDISHTKGSVYGLTSYYGPKNGAPTGCKVWIYSRQSKREIADTFFHEMTHVFLQMIGGIKKQKADAEFAARWVGYLAKAVLADYSQEYGRKFTRKSRRGVR